VSDLGGATQRASNAVADTADKVGKAASQAGGQANELLTEVEDLIRQNPWASVLIAAAVGYTWARLRHH